MGLTVKLWGVRGSLPASPTMKQMENHALSLLQRFDAAREKSKITPRDFLNSLKPAEIGGYGGHTACIEVRSNKARLIIDGGSGIRNFGDELAVTEGLGKKSKFHILMTHFHWDHLIGLPFFTPIFVPGTEVHFYGVQDDLEANIRRIFCKPNFPVAFENLQAKVFFHKLEPRKPVMFDDIKVTPYMLDHPDPCWGYRFENGGKVFSYCVDTECRRVSREQMGADLPLYQNVDLLIFDAQYTFLEATERVDWGHASGPIGIDVALREQVKRVLFVHHDPAASTQKILEIEKQTREYYEAALVNAAASGMKVKPLDWGFAPEGMIIEL